MSATGTKEKLVKLPIVRPPAEIRDNTKARRAWLADQVATINAQPNRRAKITGLGSYQQITVHEVTMVEGRLRNRGACQCCGHWQVVDDDRVPYLPGTGDTDDSAALQTGALVMHGYNRPGDGYLIGKCPGVGMAPLNVQKTFTEQWSAGADAKVVDLTDVVAAIRAEINDMLQANYLGEGKSKEPGAYQAQPKHPRTRYNQERLWTPAEKQAVATFHAAMKEWAVQFPITSKYEELQRSVRQTEGVLWRAKQEAEHFRHLLSSGIYGSELRQEIVV